MQTQNKIITIDKNTSELLNAKCRFKNQYYSNYAIIMAGKSKTKAQLSQLFMMKHLKLNHSLGKLKRQIQIQKKETNIWTQPALGVVAI